METSFFLLKLFLFLLFADLLTGIFHFLVDQYGREDIPFIGMHLIKMNNEHHHHPRKILLKNYWQVTYQSWIIGALIIGILGIFGIFSLPLTIALAIGANANLFHQWTHRTRKENGPVITFLQDAHIIQSRKHHGWHHAAPYDTNYCVMTDWLNPILHKIRFWETVIFMLGVFGIKPVDRTKSID